MLLRENFVCKFRTYKIQWYDTNGQSSMIRYWFHHYIFYWFRFLKVAFEWFGRHRLVVNDSLFISFLLFSVFPIYSALNCKQGVFLKIKICVQQRYVLYTSHLILCLCNSFATHYIPFCNLWHKLMQMLFLF